MIERFSWFKQSALRWSGAGPTVYIDPWGVRDDDEPAHLILITHAHSDHFVPEDIDKIRTSETQIVAPRDVADELSGRVTPVEPGASHEVAGIRLQAVPAYNEAEPRRQFHPKANRWVGYVLELGGTTYYHAGDTDHVAELNEVRTEVAFLPVGGTFTMDADEAAGLAREMSPRLAVPMHFGFVVGSPADAERFRAAAAPVPVEVLVPIHPFERA